MLLCPMFVESRRFQGSSATLQHHHGSESFKLTTEELPLSTAADLLRAVREWHAGYLSCATIAAGPHDPQTGVGSQQLLARLRSNSKATCNVLAGLRLQHQWIR